MIDTYQQFAIRTQNIAAFKDTTICYNVEPGLNTAVKNSTAKQKVFRGNELLRNQPTGTRNAKIILTPRKTLEAAQEYAAEGKKVAILNCASSVKPGGETESGYASQEENLCRCSTLYPCLNHLNAIRDFYTPNRANLNAPHKMNSCLTNDDCIYTPGVVIFKEETDGCKMLPEEEWFTVDVISCAGPEFVTSFSSPFLVGFGARTNENDSRLENTFRRRFDRILNVARTNGVDVVILDFWGYQRSENEAKIVADAARKTAEEYASYFDTIEMAVGFSSPNSRTYEIYSKSFAETEPFPDRVTQSV